MTDPTALDPASLVDTSGPLSRDQALATLDHAAVLMGEGRFTAAVRAYQRVIGTDDRAITAAALLGFGQAAQRLGDDAAAAAAWLEVVRLPTTPATYPAWRELAAARVRSGDLAGATEAYRSAERLAPPADRAEIASRLGWLSRELGDSRAAGRYFSQARGGSAIAMTIALIALTTVVSLVADLGGADGGAVMNALQLDKAAVAQGQLWRLVTAALVHAPLVVMPIHLIGNMYAIWIVGPIVERLYGRARMLGFYAVCAVAGSLASFALSDNQVSVGASGAVFGLFGLLVASLAVQRPSLGGNTRSLLVNLLVLIGLNLYIGATSSQVDNLAHIGGLAAGAWLGALFIPTGVPALRSMWRRPGSEPGTAEPILGSAGMLAVQLAGMAGLLIAFVVLWTVGYPAWSAIAPVS